MHKKYGKIVITGAQIRAARGLAGWTAEELAKKCEMSRNTIRRLEAFDDIPPSRTQSLIEIRRVFEEAGIIFVFEDEKGGPGVRLKAR